MQNLLKSWRGLSITIFMLTVGWFVLGNALPAKAAANVAPTGLYASNTSTDAFTLNWVAGGGGDETTFQVWGSEDGVSYAQEGVDITPTTTTFLAISALTTNTLNYWIVVATGGTGDPATSTPLAVYTLATVPGVPVISSPTTSTLVVTVNTSTNPAASTTYAVVFEQRVGMVTTTKYLQADSTILTVPPGSIAWLTDVQLGSGFGTTVTGLQANTGYTVSVIAKNGNGIQTATSTAAAIAYTSSTVPGTPTATPSTTTQIDLSWGPNGNSGDTIFQIYNVTDDVVVNTTSTSSYSVTSLTPNKFYEFIVRAENLGAPGTYSASSSPSTATSTPAAAPGALVFSDVSTSTLTITWGENSNFAGTGYVVTGNNGFTTTATSTATTTALTNLSTNTSYTFTVYAISTSTLAYSVGTSASTTTLPYLPVIPANVTTTGAGTSNMEVSWDDNSSNETGFEVSSSTDGNTFSVVTTTAANVTSTNVTSLLPNTAYWFRVRATSTDGYSSYATTTVSAYTLAADVTSQVATASTSASISIQWAANNNPAGTEYVVSGTGVSTYSVFSTSTVVSTTVPLATPNTSYTINVRSKNADGFLGTNQPVTDYTKAADASTPLMSAVSTSTATLTWGDNSNPATTDYYITGNNGFTPVTVENATTTPLTSLTPNLSYTFNVQSINNDLTNNSTVAATATTTVPVDITLPVISSLSTSTLTVSWTDGVNSGTPIYQVSGNNGFSAVTTTATTKAITGLTPNLSYTFTVKVQKPDGSTYTTGVAADATTTLAIAPTSVSATVNGVSQITLSWSGGTASTYLAENTTKATDSSWISTASWISTGLSCGTSYTFRVTAKNSAGVTTDPTATVSATTNSCGGGGSSSPSSPSVGSTPVVSTGSSVVTSPVVTLNFNTANAVSVAISEDPNFVGASWQTYAATKQFTLSAGNGVKKIYVRFRSADGGTSSVYTINTTLNGAASIATAPTTPAVTPAVDLGVVSNPVSAVVITKLPAGSMQPGVALNYNYQYKNKGTKLVSVKIVRQMVDSKGKITKATTAYRTIKAGATFKGVISETVAKTTKPGTYTVKVKMYNTKTNKLIDENSFKVEVEKLKKKYFTLGEVSSVDSAIVFDTASLAKIKSNVVLPANFSAKYSYTNNTGKKQTTRVVRQLINTAGKVVDTKTGKWIMASGEKDSFVFTQPVAGNLAAGTYTIRIQVLDFTSKAVLAENSLGFTVELR